MRLLRIYLAICTFLVPSYRAQASSYVLSDEIESVGGHNNAFSNGGAAAVADVAAVRLNPAMLALESTYSMHAAYHWPARGSEFYQAGVVDSQTSTVAAGILLSRIEQDEGADSLPLKQRLKSRMALGIAKSLKLFSVGLGLQYLETNPHTPELPKTGTSLGMGVAGLLNSNLRFGASVENINDSRLMPYAPKTARFGLAYLTHDGTVSAHLDYSNREAVSAMDWYQSEEASDLWLTASEKSNLEAKSEELITLSGSAKIYDLMRVLGSYGQSTDGERQFAGLGIALVNGPASLAYGASRPDLRFPESHQSFSVSFKLSM